MRCCGCLVVYVVLAGLWLASGVFIGPEFAAGVAVGLLVWGSVSFMKESL